MLSGYLHRWLIINTDSLLMGCFFSKYTHLRVDGDLKMKVRQVPERDQGLRV